MFIKFEDITHWVILMHVALHVVTIYLTGVIWQKLCMSAIWNSATARYTWMRDDGKLHCSLQRRRGGLAMERLSQRCANLDRRKLCLVSGSREQISIVQVRRHVHDRPPFAIFFTLVITSLRRIWRFEETLHKCVETIVTSHFSETPRERKTFLET